MRLFYFQFLPISGVLHLKSANIKTVSSIFSFIYKFAFVERSRTMKAPVGLLSDRTVLRSKMEGLCPDKFQFAVLGSSRVWGRRSPTRAPSKSNKCPNADPEQQRPKAGYHHGDGILPFVLYLPVLSWESVVY